MRYVSVESTSFAVPRLRRRLGFLVCNKCRLPARERMTLPRPVILNRLATAFLVLMPFGRRIIIFAFLSERTCNIDAAPNARKMFFSISPDAMKYLRFWIMAGLAGFGCATQAASQINFDFDWRFHLGDVPEASAASFDDKAWRLVDLPHDFSIESDFNRSNVSSTA